MSGRNHLEETKTIMSEAKKGENNPMYGKTGENSPMFNRTGEKNPMFNQAIPEGAGRPSQKIEVVDLQEKTTTYYNSINEAARALNLP
jgi:dihydroorotate dehydrogenase